MGTVARSGVTFGVDPDFTKEELMGVDWLPGGCVLFHKCDLILEDYFPYSGKAFCEDALAAGVLKQRGIKKWMLKSTKAFTTHQITNFDYISAKIIRTIRRDVVRAHFGRTTVNYILWAAIDAALCFYKKILSTDIDLSRLITSGLKVPHSITLRQEELYSILVTEGVRSAYKFLLKLKLS